MAQLTDDCFAFSGPLLPIDEVERLIARARDAGRRDRDACRSRAARGRVLARDVVGADRSAAVRQFRGRRLRGAPRRSRRRRPRRGSRSSTGVDRRPRGRAARSAPGEAIRIFTGAPMPAGADTVFMQEDVRVDGDAVIVPPGLEARRQPPARRRGRARGRGRAAGRPAACRRRMWRSRPRSA